MPTRIRCVNCGICVNRIARHVVLEQDTEVVSIIAESISPRIVMEHDEICQTCLKAALIRVNQIDCGDISSKDEQHAKRSHTRVIGHTSVCLMCGHSILRKRSDPIFRSNPSQLHQMIAAVITNSIELHKMTTKDRVCQACWLKAKRKALRIQAEQKESVGALPSKSIPNEKQQVEHNPETFDQPSLIMEQVYIAENVGIPEIKSDEVDIDDDVTLNSSVSSTSFEKVEVLSVIKQSVFEPVLSVTLENDRRASDTAAHYISPHSTNREQHQVSDDLVPSVVEKNVPAQVPTMTLENYRRASNTAAHCIFPRCTNRELHRVSDDLRIKIIMDHHFYLPVHTSVCTEHLLSNSWDTLYNSENSNAVFTVQQIEHMFSFINVNRTNIIDFNDPFTIDDHLFQYWVGLTKEKFRSLLIKVPQIQTMHQGVTGLVACLIKLRNGDSDERIASLMNIPHRSLKHLINNVKEIIVHFVPEINPN